jgi:hypothetical protein
MLCDLEPMGQVFSKKPVKPGQKASPAAEIGGKAFTFSL